MITQVEKLRQRRVIWKSEGRCQNCGGDEELHNHTTLCKRCADRQSENTKRLHQERLQQNLCIWCGQPALVDDQRCNNCRRKNLNDRYQKKYGITLDIAERLLKEQDCKCLLCMKQLTERTFVVDHCHRTGDVRGLLCKTCNSQLGHYERMETLGAKEYVNRKALNAVGCTI